MTTRAELETILTQLPGVEKATVVGERALVATVVSDAFRHLNEAERQEQVWGYVRKELGKDALQNIEFILTNTPEEDAA